MLLVLLICLGLVSVNGDCTDGLMDYELLKQKASQIPNQGGSAGSALSRLTMNTDREYVMPSLKFTCSGVITGFLLGVDVRINGDRTLYPKIRLLTVTGSTYSLVSGSEREIILNADDFSTSGLYNYTLPVPIEFNDSQILGAQQFAGPKSRVRLYHQPFDGQIIYRVKFSNNLYQRADSGHFTNSRLLLHPITDNSDCDLSAFISSKEIEEQARFITTVRKTYDNTFGVDLFYEDIGFSCNGSITGVVIGAEDNTANTTNPPEIRIWRSDGNGRYAQTGPVIPLYYNNATSDVSTQYLRWYNLSEPVSVLDGDILGIYHYQPIIEADSIIYYQRFSGPANYHANNMPTDYNMYPLVSVIFEITVILMSSVSSATAIATSSLVLSSVPLSASIVDQPIPGCSRPITSSTVGVVIGRSSNITDGSLVGGIAAVIIVLAIIALVAVVIIALVVKRRRGKAGEIALENIELKDNPVYQQIALKNIKLENNPVYGRVDQSSAAPTQNTYQPGLYVPTNAQRKKIMDEKEEGIYEDTQYLNLRNEAEEPIYWYPENNTKDNYEQLAQKKYQIMIDCSHPVDRPTFESISSQLSHPPPPQPDDDTLSSLGTTVNKYL